MHYLCGESEKKTGFKKIDSKKKQLELNALMDSDRGVLTLKNDGYLKSQKNKTFVSIRD
jgi:hypothetical protein